MRLNKYLARYAGVSRREADRLIEAGEVTVNKAPASLGMSVSDESDEVSIGGRRIIPDCERHYYAAYKPVGYISSTVRQGDDDLIVTDLAPDVPYRLFPVGRLDKDSEGLIILTDDGTLADRVLRSRNGHEKEYIVRLSGPVTDEVIDSISAGGLDIGEKRLTGPCSVERISEDSVRIVLKEGMNRQIRRVFELFDEEVTGLLRVRFMNILISGLKPGDVRELRPEEIRVMKEMTEDD